MAHIAKYKATSVGHMLAHYRRDESSLGRDNIDPKRVKNDMVVAHYTNKDGKLVVGRVVPREGEPNWGTVERRIERVNEAQKAAGKRATRKDAVVMADVVVTLPDNVRKGDEDRFFRLTYWYLSNKFGIDNMMGGFVHKDEVLKDGTPARDHMHAPFTPILDGRFNYKQMCPRSFYQSMHKELGDYLEKRMGYRPAIELDEETRARRVYTDKSVDIDRVRGAVDKAVVEPAQQEAERIVAAARAQAATIVRDAEMRKAELVTQIADKEGDLAELDSRLSDVRMDIEDERARFAEERKAGEMALRKLQEEVRQEKEKVTAVKELANRNAAEAEAKFADELKQKDTQMAKLTAEKAKVAAQIEVLEKRAAEAEKSNQKRQKEAIGIALEEERKKLDAAAEKQSELLKQIDELNGQRDRQVAEARRKAEEEMNAKFAKERAELEEKERAAKAVADVARKQIDAAKRQVTEAIENRELTGAIARAKFAIESALDAYSRAADTVIEVGRLDKVEASKLLDDMAESSQSIVAKFVKTLKSE